MKVLEGQIEIRGGHHLEDNIEICLIDTLSRCEVTSIQINPADFMAALRGGHVTCTFEHAPDRPVGMRQEHKRERVEIPGYPYRGMAKDPEFLKALAVFEVDGWVGDRSDAENSHHLLKRNGSDQYAVEVRFFRHVAIEETP